MHWTPKHSIKLPRIVGWNLVKLAYQEFIKNMIPMYLRILNAQLCVYYYPDIVLTVVNEIEEDSLFYTECVTTNNKGKVIYKNTKSLLSMKTSQLAQYW